MMRSFKKFCLDYKKHFPGDHRTDFINDAVEDISFPWEDRSWSCIDYLESVGANAKCINCFEELHAMFTGQLKTGEALAKLFKML
jgi:uncharacterized protein YozE (UPF0346 family)